MSRSNYGTPDQQRRELLQGRNAEEMMVVGVETGTRTNNGVTPTTSCGVNAQTATSGASVVEMLRQASRHAQAAIETGLSTTRELQVQGEQMERIARGLDDIEENMKRSDRTLRGFSRRVRVKNWFLSKLGQKTDSEDANIGVATGSNVPKGAQSYFLPNEQSKQRQQDLVGCSTLSTEEDKMIDSLLYNVGILRQQALLQGELLDDHNQRLDVITTKTDAVHEHVVKTTQKVKKMT